MSNRTKTLTVRLPQSLHAASCDLAERSSMSLNALVQQSLAETLKQDEYARLYQAFSQVAEDEDECDVEYAVHAQWEVLTRGES